MSCPKPNKECNDYQCGGNHNGYCQSEPKEDFIRTLEIAKAEVEWEYPLDYCIAIDKAIAEIEFLRKWKADIVNKLAEYDCESIDDVAKNAYNKGISDLTTELLKYKSKDESPIVCLDISAIRAIARRLKVVE